MQHQEGLFNGAHDKQLYYQNWLPKKAPRAAAVIVHGFSDHCGRYDNLVEGLLEHDLVVYSYDLRGHGRSSGQVGHVDDFDDYQQDTRAFINLVKERYPELPFFLYGHSMGGLIALNLAIQHPEGLSGVIASVPLLGIPAVSPAKIMASRLLSRLWPTLSMNVGLEESAISRDEEAVRAYRDDPLVPGRGTVRLATELEKTMAETQANAHLLVTPLLIYFGSEDRITNPEYSKQFYNNVQHANKRMISFTGGYHENHNDIHYEEVVTEVAQWIEDQLDAASNQHEQVN